MSDLELFINKLQEYDSQNDDNKAKIVIDLLARNLDNFGFEQNDDKAKKKLDAFKKISFPNFRKIINSYCDNPDLEQGQAFITLKHLFKAYFSDDKNKEERILILNDIKINFEMEWQYKELLFTIQGVPFIENFQSNEEENQSFVRKDYEYDINCLEKIIEKLLDKKDEDNKEQIKQDYKNILEQYEIC